MKSADRFDRCRDLLIGAVLVVVVALSIVLIDSVIRTGWQKREASLFHALGLSNLSLVPAGRALRNPEARTLAVDLRFTPALPNIRPDPAEFLIASPQTVVGKRK